MVLHHVLAWALLNAAPVQLQVDGSSRPKIIVLDLVNGADLDEARLEALSDAVVTALSGAPVEVLSASDLRATMQHRQSLTALGCLRKECLLDLASVWKARYLLTGSLAAFKDRLLLSLKLIDTKAGSLKVLLRETQEGEADTITALTRVSAAKIRQALGGPAPTVAELAVLKAGRVPLVGLSVGALSAGALLYALGVDRWAAVDLAERAQEASADPVLGPHFRDQSEAVLGRSNVTALVASLGLAGAAWLWSKGW